VYLKHIGVTRVDYISSWYRTLVGVERWLVSTTHGHVSLLLGDVFAFTTEVNPKP